MEPEAKDMKTWEGLLLSHLGGHLYIDLTKTTMPEVQKLANMILPKQLQASARHPSPPTVTTSVPSGGQEQLLRNTIQEQMNQRLPVLAQAMQDWEDEVSQVIMLRDGTSETSIHS